MRASASPRSTAARASRSAARVSSSSGLAPERKKQGGRVENPLNGRQPAMPRVSREKNQINRSKIDEKAQLRPM